MNKYEGNNPVKYTVSHFDGVWASTMWMLTGIDGPLPVGDIIYGIGITVELIGLAYAANKYSVQTFDIAIPQVKVNEEEKKLPTFIYRSGGSKCDWCLNGCEGWTKSCISVSYRHVEDARMASFSR